MKAQTFDTFDKLDSKFGCPCGQLFFGSYRVFEMSGGTHGVHGIHPDGKTFIECASWLEKWDGEFVPGIYTR